MRHPLLHRQLKRLAIDEDAAPTAQAFRALLQRVERTYEDADRDRYTLERSLAISSEEMRRLYENEREAAHRRMSVQRHELDLAAAMAHSAMEAAPFAIVCLDIQGRLVGSNAKFEEMWGLPPELVSSGDVERILSWVRDRSVVPDELVRHMEGLLAHPLESSHHEIALKDGRCIERHSEPLASEDGVHVGRVWFFHDISGRKRTEARLAQRVLERTRELHIAEDHLRTARKLETVGRLAGGVAHDFNNILAVVLSFSELLMETLEDAEARADLEQIQKAAQRGASLTHQLLAFSRQQVLRAERMDINAVISDMERMVTRLIGEDVRYQAHLAPEPAVIEADPGQVQQVLMNLAVNARDAMPGGGTLVVSTSVVVVDHEEAAAHEGVRAGPHVALTVADTGEGMDEAVLERIFEPFFTTKPRGRGTGLGLSTVFGIVRQSGGHIAVESRPGRGTTFSVRFPAVAPIAARVAVAESSVPVGAETVLLVEDEDAVREAARRILQRAGFSVVEASSGRDALALLAVERPRIDLVLTDVVMPAMSGRELVGRLLAQRPELRVLYMSGYTDHALLGDASIDARQLIQKPFAPRILLSRVRQALDGPPLGSG